MSLFEPLNNGIFNLPNRIAMAPLTRGRATPDHIPTDIMTEYYSLRTDALLIGEATGISRQGLGFSKAPGIWNNTQVEMWKKITNEVHKKNGFIGIYYLKVVLVFILF